MTNQPALDYIDQQILQALIEDGRASVEKVAERVGLSPTPARRRIRRLEEMGAITGYRADVDASVCGLGLRVFVLVTLDVGQADSMTQFESAVQQMPEVQSCDLLAGPNCYILSVLISDMQAYNSYLRNRLTQLPAVYAIETRFVIDQVKNTSRLPLAG